MVNLNYKNGKKFKRDNFVAKRVASSGFSGWRISRRNTPESMLKAGEAETLAFAINNKAWAATFETVSPGTIDQKMQVIGRVFSSFKAK